MWVPGQADNEYGASNQEHRVSQRLHVVGPTERHEGKTSENHDTQYQHQEDAVEEINHLGRLGRVWLCRNQTHCNEEDREYVFRGGSESRGDFPSRRDVRKYYYRQQGEQVEQDEQVEAPLPARLMEEHLPSDQPRENADPEDQQPGA